MARGSAASGNRQHRDFRRNGVEKLLKDLNPHKAMVPDGLHPRILKQLAATIAPILQVTFQKSLNTGKVPSDWKQANVSPIFKKGERYNAANYRPVSLTCILQQASGTHCHKAFDLLSG